VRPEVHPHLLKNIMSIVEVKVPQLSESVAEATLLQWKKKPGEAVAID
jgi:2-oxoglutarate dehydrogenase E2 component (dihydrolipoamide succinyltransferase)